MKKEAHKHHFELNIDGKTIGVGSFDLCKNGNAGFWTEKETFHIIRARVEWIGKEGILLSGFKQMLTNKYKYTEWYLRYL